MSSKTIFKEVIFFVLVFASFYIGCRITKVWRTSDVSILIVGTVVTGLLATIYYLAKINQHTDNYRAFEISPGAMCRGGSYMWQGDSARAKMCQQMNSTPEGKCAISRFNCPTGYNGMPRIPFDFTSNSDSTWSGVRCSGTNVDKKWYEEREPKPHDCPGCSMVAGEG